MAAALGTAMLASLTALIVALWPTESTVISPADTPAPAVPTRHRATPAVEQSQPVKRPEAIAGTTVPATAEPGPSATSEPEPIPSSEPETSPSTTPEPSPPPPTPEPSASPPPEPKPTFAGEWTGSVRRPGSGPVVPIKISLTEASVQGTDTAAMSWSFGYHCTARLTRANLTEQQISFNLGDVRGRGCRSGTVVLAGPDNDQANVSIVNPDGTTRLSGTVRR